MKRRGLALLLVVGVLGILAILAAAFVTLARLERRASMQRLYTTKALLLARSGIEDALARLSAAQTADYGGENWDGLPGMSVFEGQQEVFQPGALNVEDCPVRQAMRPSFWKSAAGNPRLVKVDGRERGYSGILAGDMAWEGNTYALKVEDESAKINVNGGFLDAQDRDGDMILDHGDQDVRLTATSSDTGLGWNFQLARILDVLGSQPEVGIANLGALTLQKRPPGGYRSILDLQAALGTAKDLSPYLTVSGWSDAKVVHPTAWDDKTPFLYDSPSVVKMHRLPLRLEEGGRPPVNLNGAGIPVLRSLLVSLSGIWVSYALQTCAIRTLPQSMALEVADAILKRRQTIGPFRSWGEFEAFIDSLVPSVINVADFDDQNLQLADLIKANFNPNTLSNKESPDQLNFHWIDKTDLVAWSTEGSLTPTGTFKVSAVGRTTDREGRLLAEASASSRVEAYTLLRESTQKDFVGGRSDLSSYLALADDPTQRTTGGGASWNTWGAGQGLAVMTYPAPPMALPSQAADQDGALGLATVEVQDGPGQVFLQHFDDGWDGDTPGFPYLPDLTYNSDLQTDPGQALWPDTTLSFPANVPGTLYPDGAGLQRRQCPSYDAEGKFPRYDPGPPIVNWGVFSYWTKPLLVTEYTNTNQLEVLCLSHAAAPKDPLLTQFLGIGFGAPGQWGILAENRADPQDTAHEEKCTCLPLWNPDGGFYYGDIILTVGLRWHLVTVGFNDGTDDAPTAGFLDRKGIWPVGSCGNAYTVPFQQTVTEVFAGPGARLVVGGPPLHWCSNGGPAPSNFPFGVRSTLDELGLYDFGPNAATSKQVALNKSSPRYADGRYYKGNASQDAGAFLSSLQEGGGPVRLLRASWTEALPQETRKEFWFVSDGGAPANKIVDRPIEPALKPDAAGNPRAWIEVDLMDPQADLQSPSLEKLAQDKPLSGTMDGFRYRVRFKVNLASSLNDPVLESPWFHDITFAWQRVTGPKVMSWERP